MGEGNKIRAEGRHRFFFGFFCCSKIRGYYSRWKRAYSRGGIIQLGEEGYVKYFLKR